MHSCVLGLSDDYAYGNSMRNVKAVAAAAGGDQHIHPCSLVALQSTAVPVRHSGVYQDTCLSRVAVHSIR